MLLGAAAAAEGAQEGAEHLEESKVQGELQVEAGLVAAELEAAARAVETVVSKVTELLEARAEVKAGQARVGGTAVLLAAEAAAAGQAGRQKEAARRTHRCLGHRKRCRVALQRQVDALHRHRHSA